MNGAKQHESENQSEDKHESKKATNALPINGLQI